MVLFSIPTKVGILNRNKKKFKIPLKLNRYEQSEKGGKKRVYKI